MESISTNYSELTSTLFNLSSSIQVCIDSLSSIPQHPYDATKVTYFPSNYKFPTIDDVVVPEQVCLNTIIKGFEKLHDSYQNNILEYLAKPSEYDLSDAGGQLTVLAEPLGNNKYIVTEDKYRSYIETLEIIQSIDVSKVNEDNCLDLIHKVCYSVLQSMQKKTV